MDLFGIDFKHNFGFRPSRVDGMFDHEQVLVDGKLRELAESFQRWSDDQTRNLAGKPAKGDMKALRDHEMSLRRSAEMVKWSKEKFWRAHGLAERRGYLVRGRYTDYLSHKETRRNSR